MDLCGFPKTEFYVRQALWVKNRPVLTLVPHWNWEGKEGQPIRVMALTNADRVALFINGRAIEEKPVHGFDMVEWQVPYEAGKLEAVAKKDGKDVARYAVETTGPPTQIQLTPDRTAINADGEDVAIFTVTAVDAQGRSVPVAQNKVNFAITGGGRIIGVGNGDPNCHEPDVFVPPSPRLVAVSDWRWRPATFSPGDAESSPELARKFDDSSWNAAKPGELLLKENQTAVYRARVKLTPEDLDSASIMVQFPAIDDHGWIYLNGQFVGEAHFWQGPPVIDVQKYLRAGDNVVAVGVKNDRGPGGFDPNVNLVVAPRPQPNPWSRSLFNGLAQIIVQSTGQAGEFTLTASSEGLAATKAVVQTQPCTPRPAVP
jgi:beta-galactosidase